MTRGVARRGAICAALILTLPLACDPRPAAPEPPRPNVLVIVTDDQRMDPATLEVMPKTMRLFRDQGRTFTNAVVTTPLCCPSRASILSGRYTHNHGVLTNPQGSKLDQSLTIQKELQDAGYQTGIVGKYLQGYWADPRHFDRWAVFKAEKTYRGNLVNVDGKERRTQTYLTDFLETKTLEMLRAFGREDDPWFLYLAPYPPHVPATPAKRYRASPVPPWQITPANTEGDLSDKPAYVRRNARSSPSLEAIQAQRRKELRSLKSVDDLVARVLKQLAEQGDEDTIAIFVSDNGYLHLEHGVWRKRYPYNESVRVPMFLRWPDHVPSGSTDDRIVANIDIAPTIYDALEIDPHYEPDGMSLLRDDARDMILLEFFAEIDTPTWRSLWTPRWQYVEYEDGTREYYSARDPWQLENVFGNTVEGDEPTNERNLSRRLREVSSCSGERCL